MAAGHAIASDDNDHAASPGSDWLSIAQITQKLTTEGYDVRKIDVEDGAYEVYALDKDGKRIESYVDPLTGDLLHSQGDDHGDGDDGDD